MTELARGVQILAELKSEGGSGNEEIAERTGLARANVTRLTYTLTTLGQLREMPAGEYFADVGLLSFSAPIQPIAHPFMKALMGDPNCSLVMSKQGRNSVVFLEFARPRNMEIPVNTVGDSVLPIHSMAIVLAYLIGAPVAEREQMLELLR